MSRIKVQKAKRKFDPEVAEMVGDLTKELRQELELAKDEIHSLTVETNRLETLCHNLGVALGDLHTSFMICQTSVDVGSTKAAVKEFAELGVRSLSDYETPSEDAGAG